MTQVVTLKREVHFSPRCVPRKNDSVASEKLVQLLLTFTISRVCVVRQTELQVNVQSKVFAKVCIIGETVSRCLFWIEAQSFTEI